MMRLAPNSTIVGDDGPTTAESTRRAASNIGHMLSVLEALMGQLCLVTVIAVLVSHMHFQPRKTGKP
jgi:hypothetical protein